MSGEIEPAWLMCEGKVVAAAEIARGRGARRRGLKGREDFHGAFVLQPCRHVHTFGMRAPIDVAFCAADGRILRATTMPPWRLSRFVWGSRFVVEAEAGAFERWNLDEGDQVEVVDEAHGDTVAGG